MDNLNFLKNFHITHLHLDLKKKKEEMHQQKFD